jgi:hypothetical protein
MAHRKTRIPKKGDRVAALGHNGAFVVYSINISVRSAELKLIGHDLALSSIPWGALTFLDEEDASQAAARIVREATEKD